MAVCGLPPQSGGVLAPGGAATLKPFFRHLEVVVVYVWAAYALWGREGTNWPLVAVSACVGSAVTVGSLGVWLARRGFRR